MNTYDFDQFRIDSLDKYLKYDDYYLVGENTYRVPIITNNFNSCNKIIRIMKSEINNYAIDSVEIISNNSIFNDEELIHKIQFLPVKVNESSSREPSIKLNIKSNTDYGRYKIVKFKDFSINEEDNIEFVNEEIPIIYLQNNQEINITAYLNYGKPKEHSKYQSVSTVTMINHEPINNRFILEIEIIGSKTIEDILSETLEVYKMDLKTKFN